MNITAKRFDVGNITGAQKTPQGFLRAPAFATRVGVFKYKKPDGTLIREYRPAEEVFNPESLATLANIPVTNKHPAELLNPSNAQKHTVGYTGDEVKQDQKYVSTTVTIVDGPTIKEIESGVKQETSCGYTCELANEPGVFEGEPYDYVQKKIIYNHLAIVGKGRAGPDVRLRLDSQDAVMVDNQIPKEGLMEKVNLGGVDHEMHPEAAKAVRDAMAKHGDALKAMQDKCDGLQKSMDEMKVKVSTPAPNAAGASAGDDKAAAQESEKKFQGAQAKADALAEEIKTLKEQTTDAAIAKRVKARVAIETVAARVGVKKFDDMSDLDLKKAVIATKSKIDLKDKVEAYVDARFDSVVESLGTTTVTNQTRQVTEALNPSPRPAAKGSSVHMDTEIPNTEEIRKKRQDEDLAAWQKPLAKNRDQILSRRSKNN